MAISGVGVDEPFYFSSSGSNDEGKIEIVANNVEISNLYNGGEIIFKCNTAGGIPNILLKLSPNLDDGAVYFCSSRIFFRTISGNSYFDSNYGSSVYRNLISGGTMRFSVRNSSAVLKDCLILNPNTETANMLAYSTVIKVISSDSDSVDVRGVGIIGVDTTSNNVTIGGLANGVTGQPIRIIKTSSANDMILEHLEPTGTQKLVNNTAVDLTFSNYGGTSYVYNGANWYEVNY
jgi:hypothetical protein